ncbi:MAG: autotransporter-associated beta strand repeat-containing protein, partial [Gammaproteobacteria bacterium]|nr:autotransporter-associated beta strand repeat-containing protein [Gammaproteobacteria bacterium]
TLVGAGTIKNSGGGSGTASALLIGNGATTTAPGLFTGIIQDGGGVLNVVKQGTGTQSITGLNTYTGATVINSGILAVTSLANGGVASGIGASSSAASNLVFNGGTLTYTGSTAAIFMETQSPSVLTDRLFTLAANGTISSEGSYGQNILGRTANHASLVFTSLGTVDFAGAGVRTLTLTGDSIGDNVMGVRLVNNTNANEALSVTKASSGLWILAPNTGVNIYTGATTISGGALQAVDGVGLSSFSNLTINGGVFQTSGLFNRNIGTAAGEVQITGGASGFAASNAPLTVTLNGGSTLTWGAAGFAPTSLVLSSNTALFDTTLTNNINLGVAARTVTVNSNGNTGTMMTAGYLAGEISGGVGGNITKNGNGVLVLGNANTYAGNTILNLGTLVVSSIGSSGATFSSLGTNVAGGVLQIGNAANTLNLLYVGGGEIATRNISILAAHTTGTIQIDSSGSGALELASFTNAAANTFVLQLRGTNTDRNTISANLADSGAFALRVIKTDGGVWALTGTNTHRGGTRVDAGLLGLSGTSSVGTVGPTGLTSNAVANVVTVTLASGSTANLRVGMYVNGPGISWGDTVASIVDGTTFTLSAARTMPANSELVFGGVLLSNSGIFATDPVGGLTLSQPVILNNSTVAVFGGSGAITINNNIYKATGANDQTFSNNLEGGAVLTINGDFVNFDQTAGTRTLSLRGYGSTEWNGVIRNSATAAVLTGLNIALAPNAYIKFSGGSPNTYSGTTTFT